MPFMILKTSMYCAEEKQASLLKETSAILAEVIGKPEAYVMVTLEQSPIFMGGTDEPAAFADVRSIGGLSPEVNKSISAKLAEVLENHLGIPRARFYLNFSDVQSTHWGYNGGTFG